MPNASFARGSGAPFDPWVVEAVGSKGTERKTQKRLALDRQIQWTRSGRPERMVLAAKQMNRPLFFLSLDLLLVGGATHQFFADYRAAGSRLSSCQCRFQDRPRTTTCSSGDRVDHNLWWHPLELAFFLVDGLWTGSEHWFPINVASLVASSTV